MISRIMNQTLIWSSKFLWSLTTVHLPFLYFIYWIFVVYFDQPMGALEAVGWSKPFASVWKQVFSYFYITDGKKERKRKGKRKYNTKNMHKRGSTSIYVVLSEACEVHGAIRIIFVIFLRFFTFMMEKDGKTCFSTKK